MSESPTLLSQMEAIAADLRSLRDDFARLIRIVEQANRQPTPPTATRRGNWP